MVIAAALAMLAARSSPKATGTPIDWLPPLTARGTAVPALASVRLAAVGRGDRVAVGSRGAEGQAAQRAIGIQRDAGRAAGQRPCRRWRCPGGCPGRRCSQLPGRPTCHRRGLPERRTCEGATISSRLLPLIAKLDFRLPSEEARE